jgi:choline dehydrogenase-like flavoprotein
VFADGRGVAENATLEADLCIVGAGAAGIVLALELAETPLRILVVEAGGLEYEPETQDLYRGESVGHSYFKLESSRLRMFGGTTGHWNGWCRPLDPIDFEARRWVPDSGWPIDRGDLDAFYPAAQRYVQAGPFDYSTPSWEQAADARAFPLPPGLVETGVFQFSPPTRFGTVYRAALRRSRNATVLLHSNVVGIRLEAGGGAVDRLDLATLGGKRFRVRARRFVVAAGGIETPRLMLASDDVVRRGVGNEHDLVGRYFADHPHAPVALASLPEQLTQSSLYSPRQHVRGTTVRGVFVTAEPMMRAELNLRFSASIDRVGDDPYVDHDSPDEKQTEELGRDLGAVEQGLAGGGAREVYSLFMRAEQAPNRDSRVTLADDVDALGMPRARLDWRLGELDRASIGRSVRALARAFGTARLGHVYSRPERELDLWEQIEGGYHHLGTARMHDDPRRGVVDRDCRVHGVRNLYLAGSSVFPTTGYANPTLTIVALAARLARHLRTDAA